MFLMYRVELKAGLSAGLSVEEGLFLMYRMELKVYQTKVCRLSYLSVPNVPRGVESEVFSEFIHYADHRS